MICGGPQRRNRPSSPFLMPLLIRGADPCGTLGRLLGIRRPPLRPFRPAVIADRRVRVTIIYDRRVVHVCDRNIGDVGNGAVVEKIAVVPITAGESDAEIEHR